MKYIKLYEDNSWEYTTEKLDELVMKYSNIQKNLESDLQKTAMLILNLTAFDIYADIDNYKRMLKQLEDKRESIDSIKDGIWKIIDMYPSINDNDNISNLEDIHSKIDWIDLEFGDLKDLLDEMLDFFKNINNKEILSKVLKGEFTREI